MVEQQIFETPPSRSEQKAPGEVIEEVAGAPVRGAKGNQVAQERPLKQSKPDVQIPASDIQKSVEAVSLSGFD